MERIKHSPGGIVPVAQGRLARARGQKHVEMENLLREADAAPGDTQRLSGS
jgi:hypothetical protein